MRWANNPTGRPRYRRKHHDRVIAAPAASWISAAAPGILALATIGLLKRRVIATDIEPWSVRICAENARLNAVPHLMRAILADGWRNPDVRAPGPYDPVFANILARPLCAMAKYLAAKRAPGGTAILAGLLGTEARMVLAAHRRRGLVLERRIDVGRGRRGAAAEVSKVKPDNGR